MSEIEVTGEQALKILDTAASMAPLTRRQHVEVQVAVDFFSAMLADAKQRAEKERKDD